MKHFHLYIICPIIITLAACTGSKRDAIGHTEVTIETSEGDIIVRLYDDTPLHRDNFICNVRQGCYDGILFNRIVPEMVIQTGDTTMKAKASQTSQGCLHPSPSTGIPAEIVYPRHFHKQGALAAAREPDSINPSRLSSPLQWYIVTGKKYTSAELRELQTLIYDERVAALFETLLRQHAAQIDSLRCTNHDAWQQRLNDLQVQAEQTLAVNPPQPLSETQKQTYNRLGGAPHLNGDYTVFGEVVEGMPIALRIGRTPVDAKERPRKAVYIKKVTIKQ